MSDQSSSLLQTESKIQNDIFSQFKCVIGANNCLYESKKSLKAGKMHKNVKSKSQKATAGKPKNGQTIKDTEAFLDE